MNRRTALAVASALCALCLASCVGVPTPPTPEPAAPLPHSHKLTQVERNGKSTYVACVECPKPTLKTLARLDRPVAPAAAPATVAAPSQAPAPQPSAPRTQAPPPRHATATVLFDVNSALLTPRVQSQLVSLEPLLRQATRIQVTAYTDAQGDLRTNTRIADARALSIVLAIRDRLEPTSSTEISGTGRPLCCYVADNKTADSRKPNRRAEVAMTLPASQQVQKLIETLSQTDMLRGVLQASMPQPAPDAAAVRSEVAAAPTRAETQ